MVFYCVHHFRWTLTVVQPGKPIIRALYLVIGILQLFQWQCLLLLRCSMHWTIWVKISPSCEYYFCLTLVHFISRLTPSKTFFPCCIINFGHWTCKQFTNIWYRCLSPHVFMVEICTFVPYQTAYLTKVLRLVTWLFQIEEKVT